MTALHDLATVVTHGHAGWRVAGYAVPGEKPDALAEALYAHWYTGRSTPGPGAASDPPLHTSDLLPALRAAHPRRTEFEDGWVVVAATPRGVVTAMCDGDVRVLRPGEYVAIARPGVPPAPGEAVAALARFDRLDAERSLWWTFGGAEPESPLGRVYLDVRAATAPRVVAQVATAVDATGVGWKMKCSTQPRLCERVDAMVLYHERDRRHTVLGVLRDRWDVLEPLLDPACPPFTFPVAPGLAWADDDGDPEHSFGDLRCRAVAAALLDAEPEWAAADAGRRVAIVARGLRAAGVDPARPWRAAA
jgi:hypothetical protein